jgi:arylsulfatase A-like enzyme
MKLEAILFVACSSLALGSERLNSPDAACLDAAPVTARDLPHILVILADDLGIGDVSCYHPESKISTPHMDRLARQGMRFTNAYAAAAHCVPSRYGLLTGRYPFRAYPMAWQEKPTIAPGRMTVASLLKEAGYATACVGKWHCGFDGGTRRPDRPLTGGPLDRGFDYFFGQPASPDQPPYFYIRGRRAVQLPSRDLPYSEGHDHTVKYQGRYWRAGKVAPNYRQEEILERFTADVLQVLGDHHRRESPKPLFLYYAMTAPHGPWVPDKPFQGKSRVGPLGDFVMQVDDIIGRILRKLDTWGVADNTLVLLTSDNGPLWFDPDVARYGHDSSGIFRGRKGDIWEGGLRMPLIVRWPGRVPAGRVSHGLFCLTDLMATCAALCHRRLPRDAGEDSVNQLPTLLGQTMDAPLRRTVILQSVGGQDLAIRRGPWKLIPWLGSGGFLSHPKTRTPGAGEPEGQLYDLEADPEEQKNVYAAHPEVVAELMDLLEERQRRGRSRP